jgi:hypothetical protein
MAFPCKAGGPLDYYQGVVIDYLRADRSVFINSEYCIEPTESPDNVTCGDHWYCDAVAMDFRSKTIFLCEVTFAANLSALISRLSDWHKNWDEVQIAIIRQSNLDDIFVAGWSIKPWLFVPKERIGLLERRLDLIGNGQELNFKYEITCLEDVQPWLYKPHNRLPDLRSKAVI